MHFLSRSPRGAEEQRKAVMVSVGDGLKLIGFVTRQAFRDLPDGIGEEGNTVAVYLPMSYQIGGYTVFLPRSSVKPLDMSVEQVMRFALTAGMTQIKPSP